MGTGSSDRPSGGSKCFDFAADDVLCSYDDFDGHGADPKRPPEGSKGKEKNSLSSVEHTATATAEADQVVNPFEVSTKPGGKIDYKKIVADFSLTVIEDDLVRRVERLTGRPAHYLLRRRLFFAHRDLEAVLDAFEKGEKFYIFLSRCPTTESMHLGHLAVFTFAKYLQDAFKVAVVIQLTDSQLRTFRGLPVKECIRLALENTKDIIACGFDITKTFIFSSYGFTSGEFYRNQIRFERNVEFDKVLELIVADGEDHVGKLSFFSARAAASFSNSFPHLFSAMRNFRCIIPCAINQDAFVRLTQEVAPTLRYLQPASIESSFVPALQGYARKMSSSDVMSAIFLTDSPKVIKDKINRNAFSGGQDSVEKHRKYGANLEVDVPVRYLDFFLDNDAELEHLKKEYGSGRMLTGEVKKRVIEVITATIQRHQQRRAAILKDEIDVFTAQRPFPDVCA